VPVAAAWPLDHVAIVFATHGWAWLPVLAAGLSLIAILGVAFAVLRSNVAKTTAELWKGEAEATKAKADRLELDLEDARHDHTECQDRLNVLRDDHEALKAIVLQALRSDPELPAKMKPLDRRRRPSA
jgi:hypothetical protein